MIPVHEPVLGKKEFEYVNDCLNKNWISTGGEYNKKFEEQFSKFCNVKYGVATTNGTTALHLSLLALKIGKGDEVIVPDFTMASCGFAVKYVGAKPVFVDAKIDTWNMDPEKIEAKITNKTKAIMVVHIYGLPSEMDKIMNIAKKHKLKVIEDCAEAHGATFNNQVVGSFGDVSAFSFYSNKIITMGEGGILVTNDIKYADRARWLHSLSFDKERRYIHDEVGYNFRLSNVQASIGLAQLERIDEIIAKKREVASYYNKYLSKIKGIKIPLEPKGYKNVYWMYGIMVEDSFGINRDELKKKLFEAGIDTRFFFTPLHKQPCFSEYNYSSKDYPVSIELCKKGLYLPSSLNLAESQVKQICEKIKEIGENK